MGGIIGMDRGKHGRAAGHRLLDLFEPGYGPAFAPYILDNAKFPDSWFETTTQCNKDCRNCTYCQSVLEKILIEG